jgi:diguanylate cyclase (GGDEF)-like protein
MHQYEQMFRQLAESVSSGVLHVDSGRRVVYANEPIAVMLGASDSDRLADQVAGLGDADRKLFLRAVDAALDAGHSSEVELQVSAAGSDETRRCSAVVVAVTEAQTSNAALITLNEIDPGSARAGHSAEAGLDALTGVLNRASLIAELERALGSGRAGVTGVVHIDLDEFRLLNDTFGHDAGDELLIEVVERVRSVLRDGDRVGRIGGDEFLIVCPQLADPDQATAIAARIRERLSGPASLSAGMVSLRASLGLAIGAPGASVDDLLARSKAAMSASKRGRLGRVVLS